MREQRISNPGESDALEWQAAAEVERDEVDIQRRARASKGSLRRRLHGQKVVRARHGRGAREARAVGVGVQRDSDSRQELTLARRGAQQRRLRLRRESREVSLSRLEALASKVRRACKRNAIAHLCLPQWLPCANAARRRHAGVASQCVSSPRQQECTAHRGAARETHARQCRTLQASSGRQHPWSASPMKNRKRNVLKVTYIDQSSSSIGRGDRCAGAIQYV